MMISPVGLISLPLFFILSSVITSPLSGPPLPLDPALSAIAPAECLWYASSSGVAEPNPSSNNQTERLFAEPEVEYFSAEFQKQLINAMRSNAGDNRGVQVLATEIPKLLQSLLKRPLAAFVEDFQISEDEVSVQAGMVLHAGSKRAELEETIAKLVDLSLERGIPVGSITQDGATWHVMRVSMQTPEVRWGWEGEYFILAVGEGTAETIIERLSGSGSPTWLDKIRREQTIERESSLVYLNAELLLDRLRPLLEEKQGWPIVEKLGLTSLKSFHAWSGFDELGCASYSKLVTDRQRPGLLALLPEKQLSDNDLQMIPSDAIVATAIRLDWEDTWKSLLRLGEEFDPRAVEQIESNLQRVEDQLGINLEDDLLGSFDDTWFAYLPGGDLMSSWLGAAAGCSVKDAPRLQTVIQSLVAEIQARLLQGGKGVKVRETEFAGKTIYTLSITGQPIPFTPAWCVTDDWLFVGLTPQTVRSLITRENDHPHDSDSLAGREEIQAMFGRTDAPTAITYCDTPKLVRSIYPLAQMAAQSLTAGLQKQGIEIDASILPSLNSIVRHLRPNVSVMVAHADGPACYSQHSLPSVGRTLSMASLSLGVALPAQAASRHSTELNNMKQIALAFHNYVDSNGKFPANIYDDEGNALLSWRVQLLPYLEQQALYNQFRLDEPWDSPHNKPLSSAVVSVFQSPGSPPSSQTRYLALVSEQTIFPGDEEITFRDVRDGTSNTLMFVKASTAAAVNWTEPKDLDFDPEHPFVGIDTQNGRFFIAMTDGSCRSIPATLGDDTLRALATRNGKEVIDAAAFRR